MAVDMQKLINRLKIQISVADHLDSDWAYITKEQAKKCLELAEAEDIIMDILNNDTKFSNSFMEQSSVQLTNIKEEEINGNPVCNTYDRSGSNDTGAAGRE